MATSSSGDMNNKTPDRTTDTSGDVEDLIDDTTNHLQKITDYKTYCKGLMDIALLSANANQLRHALELCAPYRTLLIVLFSLSILLQVVAGALLAIERFTCRKRDYVMCHRYNASIGVIVIIIIVVNILGSAFGGPEDECT